MSNTEKKDPFDGEYVGNVWGWKFSLIGLIFIVLFAGIIIYRHYNMGVPPGWEDPDAIEMEADSLKQESNQD